MLPKRKQKSAPSSTEQAKASESFTDVLQKQIEEERERSKSSCTLSKSNQDSERKIIYRKRVSEEYNESRVKSDKNGLNSRPKYSNLEVSTEIQVEEPARHKVEPTGFTYFDKLNEKDIFLDPLTNF